MLIGVKSCGFIFKLVVRIKVWGINILIEKGVF